MIRALVICLTVVSLAPMQRVAHAGLDLSGGRILLAQQTAQPAGSGPSFSEVSAVLTDNCTLCHAAPSPASGLRLDGYAGIMKGGKSGPVVVPGDPEKSEIIRRLRGLSEPRMPMSGPPWLSDDKIALIEQWIKAGAKEGGSATGEQRSSVEETPAAPAGAPRILYGQVAPIFQARCVKCHAAKGQLGPPPEGIRMDSYEAVINGGERPILIPGRAGASPLLRSVLGQSRPRMPMDGPPYLDAAETDLIALWINEGAPDNSGKAASLPVGSKIRLGGTLTSHWSIDGMAFDVDGKTRIKKKPAIGAYVELRAVLTDNGTVHATEIRAR
ncbi:MAG: c-type cytochrome domain-containing protein [Syntrophobacteraceae bacterium]